MNCETYTRERQHLKTLHKLSKVTKAERKSLKRDLRHLIEVGCIFYPISSWPLSIKEILKHDTITDTNTFQLILFAYDSDISPNVFMKYLYMLILNPLSVSPTEWSNALKQFVGNSTCKNEETHISNTMDNLKFWHTNPNGIILMCMASPPYF